MFGLSTRTGIVPAFLTETFSQHPQNTSTYVWDDTLKYCSTAAGVARMTVPPRISPSLAIPRATSPTVSPVGTATLPENVTRYLPGFASVLCALPALCLSAHPPFVATTENGIDWPTGTVTGAVFTNSIIIFSLLRKRTGFSACPICVITASAEHHSNVL